MAQQTSDSTTTLDNMQSQIDVLSASLSKVISTPTKNTLSQPVQPIALLDLPQGPGSQLNADKVDGINASFKAQPNTLIPLDSTGLFPTSVFPATVALGAPTLNHILVANGTTWQSVALSGDATIAAGVLTLANTAVTPGTYGNTGHYPVVTIDAKGRITSASSQLLAQGSTGDVQFNAGSGVLGANDNLFWDNTNHFLGVGTMSPDSFLHMVSPANSNIKGFHIQTNTSNTVVGLFEDTGHAAYVRINSGGGGKNPAIVFQVQGSDKFLVGCNNNSETNGNFSVYRAGSSPGEAITCNFADSGVGIAQQTPTANTFDCALPALFESTIQVNGNSTLSGTSNSVGTITTGIWHGTKIGLLYGGTNADLSGTGGASQVLRQSSSGANVTVSQLDITDVTNTDATGSGSAVLSNNCPAIDPTTPYTWVTMKSHDGSTVYFPVWK